MHSLLLVAVLACGERPAQDLFEGDALTICYRLRLRWAIAELDATDPGWRLNHIVSQRPPVPDHRNLATRVVELRKKMPRQWPQWDGLKVPGLPRADNYARFSYTSRVFDRLADHPEARLGPTETRILRYAIQNAKLDVEEARNLERYSEGRYSFRLSNGMVEHPEGLHEARLMWELLHYDALLAAEKEDMPTMLRCLRAMIAIFRSTAEDGNSFVQVNSASYAARLTEEFERLLAQANFQDADLIKLQRDLQTEADRKALTLMLMLRTQRAATDLMLNAMGDGTWTDKYWEELRKFFGADTELGPYPEIELISRRLENLAYMDAMLKWAELPLNKRPAMPKPNTGPRDRLNFIEMVTSGSITVKTVDLIFLAEASLQCGIAAIAAERFRLANSRWPERLDELTPRYLTSVPIDPFSGEAIRLKRTKDGIVVYSVGKDGTDQQGKLRYTMRDRSSPGPLDRGVQLWDPASRRQPSLPTLPPKP